MEAFAMSQRFKQTKFSRLRSVP